MDTAIDFLSEATEVKNALTKVSKLVKKYIVIDDKNVSAVVNKSVKGGKMVRPTLTLLFSLMNNKNISDKDIYLATAIELLHNATLIHDDIIDESAIRRGQPTINNKFGNDVSVYAGDLLFVSMYKTLNMAQDFEANQLAVIALNEILNGELIQRKNRFNYNMNFENYEEQIVGKTAALFSLATEFGSLNTGKTESAKAFGLNLGIAFQIADDYLDYVNTSQNNKPLFQDLNRGIYTAPLLYALEEDKSLLNSLKNEQYAIVLDKISKTTALNKTLETAKIYTDRALVSLNEFEDSIAKTAITLLVEQLEKRLK
jgi:heptaprenyl diphosphate synthase